jgi:hypothetical protein
VLHGRTEIAEFFLELYKSLQPEARKAHLIQHNINEMAVFQSKLRSIFVSQSVPEIYRASFC